MRAWRRVLSPQRRRALSPALAMLAIVVSTALVVLIPAGGQAEPVIVTPPDAQTLICPATADSKATLVAATGDASPLRFGTVGATKTSQPSPLTVQVDASQMLAGRTPVAGGLYRTDEAGQSWGACLSPSSSQVLHTIDPATATLWLTNPDAQAVSVDLTLSSDKGDVTSPGARGIQVAGHATRAVPLSVLAEAGHPLGVVVRTDQGRVAAMIESTNLGLDQSSAAATGTAVVVAGVPAKAASVRLLITNRGTQRATAQVQALVAEGPFVPQGGDGVSVEASGTIVLDLTAPLDQQAAGFSVTSDQPVSVTAVVATAKDAASAPAALPATEHVVVAPADGVLQISNPHAAEVRVEVTTDQSQTITVAAGATWSGEVATGAVGISSAEPVAVAVVVGESAGLAVVEGAGRVSAGSPVPVKVDPGLR